MIDCRLCGRSFRFLRHHTLLHGVSLPEYRVMFPGAPIMTTEIHDNLSYRATHLSDEAKAKMSAARRGVKQLPETIAKRVASLKGRPCSPETRKKIRDAQLGRKFTEERRHKLSLSHQGKSWSEARRLAGGKPWSEERKMKMSIAQRGHKMTDANRAALRQSRLGSQHSEVSRKLISEHRKGKPMPEAAKKAISETMKAKFASQHASIVRPYRTPWRRRPEYLDKQGRIWKLRSQWELSFAQYLDSQALNWTYEPCFLLLSNGMRYKPDFWVQEWNVYVEIKGWRGWGSTNKAHLAQRDGHPMLFLDSKVWETPSWVPPCKEEQHVHMDQ